MVKLSKEELRLLHDRAAYEYFDAGHGLVGFDDESSECSEALGLTVAWEALDALQWDDKSGGPDPDWWVAAYDRWQANVPLVPLPVPKRLLQDYTTEELEELSPDTLVRLHDEAAFKYFDKFGRNALAARHGEAQALIDELNLRIVWGVYVAKHKGNPVQMWANAWTKYKQENPDAPDRR